LDFAERLQKEKDIESDRKRLERILYKKSDRNFDR
jgi:hypothetical protein